MPSKKQTFMLLMPTLNEVVGLKHVLPHVDRSLFKEIIVVDGGSTDGTVEYCRKQGLTVLRQPKRGVPDAEEFGVINSTADVIVTFTPDGNSLAELLPAVCKKFEEDCDMVIVSRYAEGATSYDDDVMTGFGNWMFRLIVNLLFGSHYTDVLVGYRAYTRDAVKCMRLVGMGDENSFRQKNVLMNSWELGSSLRAARLKLKVAEIPGDEPKRIGGIRKMSVIRNGFGAVFQILYDLLFFHPPKNKVNV